MVLATIEIVVMIPVNVILIVNVGCLKLLFLGVNLNLCDMRQCRVIKVTTNRRWDTCGGRKSYREVFVFNVQRLYCSCSSFFFVTQLILY